MSQQALEIGDKLIIKSEEELLEFYRELKHEEKQAGEVEIDKLLIETWLSETLRFRGKVIEITGIDYRYALGGRTLYQGKHGSMNYSFYSEELIKIDTPQNK